ALAVANDSPWPRSLYYADGRYVGSVEWNETGPWSEIVGPVLPRGGPAGVILKGGRILAEWGDTFSRRHDLQRGQELPDRACRCRGCRRVDRKRGRAGG